MSFLFFSGRVDWWWIFRKIFLAFMVSTKDSASCPGQLATSQDITGRSSETGPISWYNEDEWRDENFQGWNCFHMTCSEQQNITFNDWSFREIPQIRGWQEMKKKSRSSCKDVLAADDKMLAGRNLLKLFGMFCLYLTQDGVHRRIVNFYCRG